MEERTLWFATWHQAVHYAHQWGIDQKPALREVWTDYAWREQWSLRVTADWEIPLANNVPGSDCARVNTLGNKSAQD